MEEGKLLGRGIAFPPRLGTDGRWLWSAGSDNIRESIQLILMTEPGERLMLPGFGAGLRRFLFEPNTPATHRLIQERVQQALTLWEKRITVQSVNVTADPDDYQQAVVTIEYRLVAIQSQQRLTLTVTTGG